MTEKKIIKLARTQNTIRNVHWGLLCKLTMIIGPFIVKTVIIKILGTEYNGLSSLFTSILTLLNLTNLGFGSTLVFTMYRAVAEEDNKTLSALLRFFRNVYRIVGAVILGLGLITMPFLPHLVNGSYPADINLYFLYTLYLLETVLDYFLFAYTLSLFEAHQRSDIQSKIQTIRYILQYALQVLLLIVFKDFYLFLIAAILLIIPTNFVNLYAAKKHYPKVRCEGIVDAETKHGIYTRVATLFCHNLGNTVLVSIDTVIISSFLGLSVLSVYSNYYYILNGVSALVQIFTGSVLSGIGNRLITDSSSSNQRLFSTLTYGWIFIVGWATTCMLCLYQPFIAAVWLNPSYLMSTHLMVFMCLYFYTWMFRIMQLTYRNAAGLWTKDWPKPLIGMVFNLAGSIALVYLYRDVSGVLIPTILVFVLIYTPWEAHVVFKYLFECSTKRYYLQLFSLSLIAGVAASINYLAAIELFPNNTVLNLLGRGILCMVIFPLLWLAVTRKQAELKHLLAILKNYIPRRKS